MTPPKSIEEEVDTIGMSSIGRHKPTTTLKRTASSAELDSPLSESLEDFTDKILGAVFNMTVQSVQLENTGNESRVFLRALSEELAAADKPRRLSLKNLDQAVTEACSVVCAEVPMFQYLLSSWKRVVSELKCRNRYSPVERAVLWDLRLRIFDYCILSLVLPNNFSGKIGLDYDALVSFIVTDMGREHGLCSEFFEEAGQRIIGQDKVVASLFTSAMVEISKRLTGLSMANNYEKYVKALWVYSKFPPLLDALAQDPLFQQHTGPASAIEADTILGPFFRISPLQSEVLDQPSVINDPANGPSSAERIDSMQTKINDHQTKLKEITIGFLHAGPRARSGVLDWFAHVMNSNHKRCAIKVDTGLVSSDAFMLNVVATLGHIWQSFAVQGNSVVKQVDCKYFKQKPRVDITTENRLNIDNSAPIELSDTVTGSGSNSITEIFFLMLAGHHCGTQVANSRLEELETQLAEWEDMKAWDTEIYPIAERNVGRSRSEVHALRCVLFDPGQQLRCTTFMTHACIWLLRTASQSDYIGGLGLVIPLSKDPPESFSSLPEYAIESVVDHAKFVSQYQPEGMGQEDWHEVVLLCIAVLESPQYIKNPHLKLSLAMLLGGDNVTAPSSIQAKLRWSALTDTEVAKKHLLPSLVRFSIECERGNSSGHLETRLSIFRLIFSLWTRVGIRSHFNFTHTLEHEFIIHFTSLLTKDNTYLLRETFNGIRMIREHAKERPNPPSHVARQLRRNGAHMQYLLIFLSVLRIFTKILPQTFAMPQITQRLASMLNYHLVVLVDLISHPPSLLSREECKYHMYLLVDMVSIYLHMRSEPAFIRAVVTDGLSVLNAMTEASKILQKEGKTSRLWDRLQSKVQYVKDLLAEEESYGEIPGEYQDPITTQLMEDPVVLPSGHVVDRVTVQQLMLYDARNPFTRSAIAMDDVLPEASLRAKIEEFKKLGNRQGYQG